MLQFKQGYIVPDGYKVNLGLSQFWVEFKLVFWIGLKI